MCSMAGAAYLVLLTAAVLIGCVHSQDTCRQTRTNLGPILGKINSVNVAGRLVKVETFWGIPYVKPPIGNLRFQRPIYPEMWTEVRRCWVPPKACLQEVDNDIIQSAEDMSEDCLYYNVWRPLCNTTNMATIVWIHGGSLRSGSSAYPLYNGEYLAARECVIVASMNYRLGALGFFYHRTPRFYGNLGFIDMRLALANIWMHVEEFGGSRSKITVAGSGAGAYLASLLLLMDMPRVNFNSAILQSGGPLMKDLSQTVDDAKSAGSQLARDLQCPYTNDTELMECLSKVDGVVLTKAYMKMAAGTQHKLVTMGGIFQLDKMPLEYLQNGEIRNLPILVGSNRDEGTEILMKIFPSDFNTTVTQPPEFSDQKLDDALTQILGRFFKPPHLPDLITRLKGIRDYEKMRNETNPTVTLLSAVIRDLTYTCPLYAFLEARANHNLSQNVYMYSFNNVPVSTQLPAWVGATHGTELQYLFGTSNTYMPADLSPSETALSLTMQKMWANFAKFGNPTPDNTVGTQWPPFTYRTSERMMVFTENAQLNVAAFNNTVCTFWNSIPPEQRV